MSNGKVKWFSNSRGYGFILGEGVEKEIFVHHSSIQMDGYRTLNEGDSVQFDLVEGPKGPKAENVARVAGEPAEVSPPVAEASQVDEASAS